MYIRGYCQAFFDLRIEERYFRFGREGEVEE